MSTQLPEEYEPLTDEERAIGMQAELISTVPPGPNPNTDYDACNAKKTETLPPEEHDNEDVDGYLTAFDGYCRAHAGSGTDHKGEGRCKWHGGNAGAPAHNQNGTKHGAQVDPHHYAQSLPANEQDFLEGIEASIAGRIRKQKGEVDFLDRVLARRVAVELHIVAKESDYVENVSGLLQTIVTEHDSHEEKAPLLEDIRQRDKDVLGMLKKLGVLEDPESQKADALDSWREFVEGDEEEDEVIDV